MRRTGWTAGVLLLAALGASPLAGAGEAAPEGEAAREKNALDFTMTTIDGTETPLSTYAGKALLIVNTASMCGNTPQYGSLEALYEKYKARGFEVLAFPANNFGGQEPGTNAKIKEFCTTTYHTTFPLFAKISVKGEDMHPLYRYLTERPGFSGDIEWNFAKFLVDPKGNVVARFGPRTDPLSKEVTKKLESVLPAPASSEARPMGKGC
jgi:glutathione peroxidase